MFYLIFVHYTFSSLFGLFAEIASHSVGHLFSLCFVYLCFWLFPILVLRAGFVFLLLQFLFILVTFLLNKT